MDKNESRIKSMVEHLEILGFRVHATSYRSYSAYMTAGLRATHPAETIRISDHAPIGKSGQQCVQVSVNGGDWCDIELQGDNFEGVARVAIGESNNRTQTRKMLNSRFKDCYWKRGKRRANRLKY